MINHPITGPVSSGPHEQPFVCETETAGLGAPLDSDCSVATVTRRARTAFGSINRGIYEIAVPADWNRRLIYNFGGGCADGWYRQGPGTRRRARRLHAQPRLRRRVLVPERLRHQLPGGHGSRDDDDGQGALHSTESPLLRHAILALDRWLTTGSGPQEGCMTRDANPTFIAERQTRDPSPRCEQLYPSASFPREDVPADIVKCRLKRIDPADYHGRLSATQLRRLREIFPTGVCAWTRPGVGQQPPRGTWLSFGAP